LKNLKERDIQRTRNNIKRNLTEMDEGVTRFKTYQERGTIVTSATYCDMLHRELKPAIRSKIRGKLSKESLLLHDNAHPHTAAHTWETLKQLKW
jgi:hypothetical protein